LLYAVASDSGLVIGDPPIYAAAGAPESPGVGPEFRFLSLRRCHQQRVPINPTAAKHSGTPTAIPTIAAVLSLLLPPPPFEGVFAGVFAGVFVPIGKPLDMVRTEVYGATDPDPVPVGVTTIVVTIGDTDTVDVGFEVLVPCEVVLVPVDVALLLEVDELLEPAKAKN
jgi:hypothetical protein